jgi:hypothetical protein
VEIGSTLTLAANVSVSGAGSHCTINGIVNPGEMPGHELTSTTLTLNGTATLKVKASTFAGNYDISGVITLNPGSIVDYCSTTVPQTVSNALTYSTLNIGGTGTKSLAGNLPPLRSDFSGAGDLLVSGGIFDLGTFTANRGTTTVGGTLVVANGATLKIGGTNTLPQNFSTGTFNVAGTVEYNGTSQTVPAQSYGNLYLSASAGAVVKTLAGTAFTVTGNFISTTGTGTAVSFNAASNITFGGDVTIGSSTIFSGGVYAHLIAGNWTNNGIFDGGTGTVTFSGPSKLLHGTGVNDFNNLLFTASNTTAGAAVAINVTGDLSTTGSGTFMHNAGGTLTLSGTSKTISGTNFIFGNLSITGTVSAANAFLVTGNLVTDGTFTASAGTVTMNGASKLISGAGAASFHSLDITGSVSANGDFSISSSLNVNGSLAATAGVVTFTSVSSLNGSADLYNVTIDGTSLVLAPNSVLGIANLFVITAGTLNVTANTPNTVNFNGAGAQTVNAITYNKLKLSNGGTKTAGGNVTANSEFTIGAGAGFSAGSFTHTMLGDWVNNGSFSAATSTIQFTGAADNLVTGATSFNILTINKTSSSNMVTTVNNVGASVVNMTLGSLNTGSNTITITGTRSGPGFITGVITRTHSFTTGTSYAFEGPDNTINFTAVTGVSSVTVAVTLAPVLDFGVGSTINRFYTIDISTGSTYTATLRLHYEDAELNGSNEALMSLWKYNGTAWTASGKSGNSTTSNYIEQTNLTDITNRWTLSEAAPITRWTGAVSGDWNNAGNWSALLGTPSMPPSINDIAEIGTAAFTNQPSIGTSSFVRSLVLGSVQPVTLSLVPGGSLTSNGNVNGLWTASATHTINAGNQDITINGDLNLSGGTSGRDINLNVGTGIITTTGSVTLAGSAAINFTGNGSLVIGKNFNYTSGTFNAGTGTVQLNGTTPQLIQGLAYNNLDINKTSGIAQINNATTIAGNLSITAGQLSLNANSSVGGNVLIASATVLDAGAVTINAAGNWTNSGSFNAGTGTVNFNGTTAQTISAGSFNNLVINKPSGAAGLSGSNTISGNLSVLSGAFDLSVFTAGRSSVGGAFILLNGAALSAGGASNFPANYSSYALGTTSLVDYNGTVTQTVAGVTYGDVHFSNGGSNAKALAAGITVNGNLTINSGATFNAGVHSISLNGNWMNSGVFNAGTVADLILNGTGKTITGATSFNRVTVNGYYIVTGSDITYNGLLNVTPTGIFLAGTGTATVSGDLTNAGILFSDGTTTFTGTTFQTIRLMNAIASTSTGVVNFNGNVSPLINATSSPLFATLNINNSGGVNPNISITVLVAFTVSSGAAFNGGISTHNFAGAFINNGKVTSDGILNLSPAYPTTIQLSGTGFSSTGVVVFGGAAPATITGAPTSLKNVIIANTYSSGITPASGWNIAGNFSINSNAVFNASTYSHTVGGNIESDGTLNSGASTFTMTSATGQLTGSPSTTFNHFTIAPGAFVTAHSDFNVAGHFSDNGVYDGSAGVLTMTGNNDANINSTTGPAAIAQLTIKKGSTATVTVGTDISTLSDLSVVSGTFFTSVFSLTEDATGGLLQVAAGAWLKIGGINTIPAFTSIGLDPLSTVEYAGTGQIIANTPIYGNLLLSAAGNKAAQLPLVIATDFTITNGNFVSNSVSVTHGIGGDFLMTGGTFDDTKISIRMNGNNGNQDINTIAPVFNLIVNKFSGLLQLGAGLTVNNVLTFTNGKISLGAYDLTLINTGLAVSGATAVRYVIADGAGRLTQAVANGGTRVYPVGTATDYMPATIVLTAGSVTDNISIRVKDKAYAQGETGAEVIANAVRATWVLSEAVIGGSNATVTLQWPLVTEMTGFNRTFSRLAQYNSFWNYGPSDIAASGADPYTVSRAGITSFSPFAVSMLNALPVTWLRISGRNEEDKNHIQWTTALEHNNSGFIIEASPDGRAFRAIGNVPGAGNSVTLQQYSFIHQKLTLPINYYRVKQVDADGRFSYSAIIRIEKSGLTINALQFSPNPVASNASLTIHSATAKAGVVQILDASGKIVSSLEIKLRTGYNTVVMDLAPLKAGLYFLRLKDGPVEVQTLKFIKN